ncbi:hypothetical protein RFI_06851 [Reticulomyxa filosa]|uniref:Uncharacterized protein n=1 Tax=Reticulomyxa filosa TaxID=46433 RepID=X6NWQ8_RETFI|nr:hypothetical protein RFI_06851 [Reticulomyxa filosa]|eukprot:ETO30269.1 hypothetical protein RFI_06851 [Reticulomyxa filosa]
MCDFLVDLHDELKPLSECIYEITFIRKMNLNQLQIETHVPMSELAAYLVVGTGSKETVEKLTQWVKHGIESCKLSLIIAGELEMYNSDSIPGYLEQKKDIFNSQVLHNDDNSINSWTMQNCPSPSALIGSSNVAGTVLSTTLLDQDCSRLQSQPQLQSLSLSPPQLQARSQQQQFGQDNCRKRSLSQMLESEWIVNAKINKSVLFPNQPRRHVSEPEKQSLFVYLFF